MHITLIMMNNASHNCEFWITTTTLEMKNSPTVPLTVSVEIDM